MKRHEAAMYSIGEFAKIALVSKRLLDHYDEIGLLRPIEIEHSTGYRLYSSKQLPKLNQILALKDLGMSLAQIKQLLQDKVSDEEIKGMLMLKKIEIEQTIADECERLRRVESRMSYYRETIAPLDIVIKSTPAQHYLGTRVPYEPCKANNQDAYKRVDQIIRKTPTHVKKADLGHFLSIFEIHEPFSPKGCPYFGYLLKKPMQSSIQLTSDIELTSQVLPRIEKMATYIQEAVDENQSLVMLRKIAKWIESNGYQVIGPCREISYGMTRVDDCLKATVEVQVPIESVSILHA